MYRIAGRVLIVCLGLFALFMAAAWRLSRDEWPAVRLDLRVTGRGADGEEVDWHVRICKAGSVFIGNRQLGQTAPARETEEEAVRRRGWAIDAFLAEFDRLRPPVTVRAVNREVESEWEFCIDEQGRLTLDGERARMSDLKTKLDRFLADQQAWPTARLEASVKGRTTADRGIDLAFAIGSRALGTLAGKPFSADDLLAAVDPQWRVDAHADGTVTVNGRPASGEGIESRLKQFRRFQTAAPQVGLEVRPSLGWQSAVVKAAGPDDAGVAIDGAKSSLDALVERLLSPVRSATAVCRTTIKRLRIKARTFDAGWTFSVPTEGPATLNESPATVAQFKARLREFVTGEKVERTKPVTVQDVLDYYEEYEKTTGISLWTIREVDLPGFPYSKVKAVFPEFPDEPKVVIKGYRGHPMFDEADQMPDVLKEYYPEKLPPVEERLPVNPAVLHGCDGIGKYSKTNRGSKMEDLMVWYRASEDDYRNQSRKIGYPALVRFDPAGRLQPNIAWRWEVSNGYRVFTFYLRKGHKWSDGEPFTAEDITYVTEVADHPRYTAQSQNWMQETDGSSLLYVDDIRDWPGLAAEILRQAVAEEPSPGRQLWKVIEGDTTGKLAPLKELLESVTPGQPPDEVTRIRVVSLFNSLFGEEGFYTPEAWQGIDLDAELEGLRARGYSRLSDEETERYDVLQYRADWLRRLSLPEGEQEWKPGEKTRLHLLLFRAAYPQFVEPARRQRVKVEALPDETGEKTIVRFTFKKPNSIFLENTATFIFYLNLCGTPRHYYSQYHPLGSKVLNVIDVLRWRDFLKRLQAEGSASEASPGKRVWSLMSDEIKSRIAAGLPRDDRKQDVEYKQAIVDDLNRIFHRRDFYDEASWEGVDFEGELQRLYKDGYAALMSNDRRRVHELLRRQDLLRRGVADLNDDELLELNLAMFRAAYDGDPKKEDQDRDSGKLLAVSREDALDKQAQHLGFRTWDILIRESRKYYDWNPHVPTLCPWRIVTEAIDTTVRAVRNPYYFKVDVEGNQLPYIDVCENDQTTRKALVQIKLRTGHAGFQSRSLEFEDYTPLKQKEKAGGYEVRLWANDYCGEMTFIICQQRKDPEMRWLHAQPEYHQALSLALNRQEMIDVVWQGMGTPAQFAVPKGSKYFNPRLHQAFVAYDPERANELLDGLGLDKRNREGVRLLPSGRPLFVEVSAEEERPLAAVQMACEYWRDVGINAQMKMRSGLVKWRLYETGQWDIWVHKEGGNYFGPLDAGGMAPTHPAEAVMFSRWVVWLRSGGREGEEPPERIKDLDRLWNRVIEAPDEDAKVKAWMALTDRAAVELPTLAVTTSPGKVIYVKNNFKNVPKLALAGWIAHEPGNCNPEVFYVEQDE